MIKERWGRKLLATIKTDRIQDYLPVTNLFRHNHQHIEHSVFRDQLTKRDRRGITKRVKVLNKKHKLTDTSSV